MREMTLEMSSLPSHLVSTMALNTRKACGPVFVPSNLRMSASISTFDVLMVQNSMTSSLEMWPCMMLSAFRSWASQVSLVREMVVPIGG